MIDFRYHLVSIIAIFIALAVGILLGSGPLKDPIDNTIQQQAEQLRTERNELRNEVAQSEQQAQYYAEFTDALTPSLVGEALEDRDVVVVTVPGTDTALADALTTSLTEAGARVPGTVGVTDAWLDPDNEGELDTLATELVPPDTDFTDTDSARDRLNTVLARSLVTRDPELAGQPDPDAEAFLASLEELDYITRDGEPSRRADFALLVAPPAPSSPTDVADNGTAALVGLAAALDRQNDGTVVAGPIEAAAEGGLVSAVRGTRQVGSRVSTVDSAQTSAGRATVVLGLVAESQGESAAYGYGPDADTVMPDTGRPDSAQPDAAQPDAAQPGAARPGDAPTGSGTDAES